LIVNKLFTIVIHTHHVNVTMLIVAYLLNSKKSKNKYIKKNVSRKVKFFLASKLSALINRSKNFFFDMFF